MQIINDIKLDFDDVLIRPKRSKATSRSGVNITRRYTFHNSEHTWEGVPIIAANMDSIASFAMAQTLAEQQMMTCLHKHYSVGALLEFFNEQPESVTKHVFYTMGIKGEDFDKLAEFSKKVDSQKFTKICCDVANGYSEYFVNKVVQIREMFPHCAIIAGNVCTPEMVQELLISGAADIVKIGIGSGACCITRLIAGVGMPQLSAIIECADVAHGIGGHIISDGGCTIPADVVKAFAAGADFVMLGSMLAATDECQGEWVEENGRRHMVLYGMSSAEANKKYNGGLQHYRAAEGRCVTVPYRGSVAEVLQQITGGIRSACAYVGAKSLKDLSKCATFVRCNSTHNTWLEE